MNTHTITGIADHLGANRYTAQEAVRELRQQGVSRKRGSLPALTLPYLCAIVHPRAVIKVGRSTPQGLVDRMNSEGLIETGNDMAWYTEKDLADLPDLKQILELPPFVYPLDTFGTAWLERAQPIRPEYEHAGLWEGLHNAHKKRVYSQLVSDFRLSFAPGVIYLGWITSHKYVLAPDEDASALPPRLVGKATPVHINKVDRGEGGIATSAKLWNVNRRKCGKGYPDEGGLYAVEDRGPHGILKWHVVDPPIEVRGDLIPPRGWVYADMEALFGGVDIWLTGPSLESFMKGQAAGEMVEEE